MIAFSLELRTQPQNADVDERGPELVSHRGLARAFGVNASTIRCWVDTGAWPLPQCVCHSCLLYRRCDAQCWLQTGRWPDGMKFRKSEPGTPEE